MAIPAELSDLASTASANSPSGSENRNTADDYLRALSGIIKRQAVSAADIVHSGLSIALPSEGSSVLLTGSYAAWNAVSGGFEGQVLWVATDHRISIQHSSSFVMPGGVGAEFWPGDAILLKVGASGNATVLAHLRGTGGTYNSSYTTMLAGAGVQAFNHGLGYTPRMSDVNIIPSSASATVADNILYVSSINSTQLQIARPSSVSAVSFYVSIRSSRL